MIDVEARKERVFTGVGALLQITDRERECSPCREDADDRHSTHANAVPHQDSLMHPSRTT